jgi:serine/threonine-protein kinase
MSADAGDPFVKGQRIDRYEIREHIGQGGMGAVYRAVDTKLGRTVALKSVIAQRRGDRLTEELRERFMREALAASRVDHRNVVQVLDFGFVDDGTPYMVMEYLRGRSLREVLKAATEPLPVEYVADIMLSVCAALRACHHVGIIHRDLKPANIFLCDTDTGWDVKVLDFGISKAPAADELTQEGQIVGTPQYLSPEQIEGAVGPEADQYALGVLLYVCLTQRLPYAGYQNVRLLRAISEGTFDPPRSLRPDLPEALEAIVLRAMRVSPRERFESIHALGQKLWDFASARGQAQWRTFYFHTPASEPTKVTTLIDERPLADLARANVHSAPTAAAPTSGDEAKPPQKPPADSTASLYRSSTLARTVAIEPSQSGGERAAVTKTAAAAGVADAASQSQSDIAGESALSDAAGASADGRAQRAARLRVALLVVGFACVVGVVFQRVWRSRAWHGGRPAPAHTTSAAAPGSTPVAAPSSIRVVSPAPAPGPVPPPVAPAAPVAHGENPDAPATPEPSRKKHATHRRKAPNTDQHGIGIPND